MPYQSTPQDRTRAYIIGAVYVFLAILLAWMLFKIWPPIPWPSDKDQDKERLASIIADVACPPDTAAKENQAASSTTASPSPSSSPTASQPATPSPSGTQTAVRPTPQASATVTQTPSPAASPTTSTTPAAATTPRTNPQTGELEIIPMKLFGQCVQTTFDERLLLLVIVVGMLGAFVHGATSLADYLGNNAFNKSWTWFYLLRPAIGMALALVFYFAIRGGFLSTTGGAKDINPYGIAALAGMVGMFSKQATDKLSEIFGTLFRSGGDDRRADSLNGSAAAFKLDPPSAVAGGDAFTLNVNGTGFVNGAIINVNDKPLTTTFVSATQLTAPIAKETIATAGTLKVTVVNPDGTKTGPVDFVVSGSSDAVAPEKPVTGEGGDPDLIDGCDVDMKADTPDEDLPITEGGVK
jgi:hypothetical protein